jgi:VIT1/CCC1 family predicted Fe2+/Mn2+ transporter
MMHPHPRLASHLRSGQVSRIIYGSIIGLALVLTMELHPPSSGTVVGALLATAVAVALAELYSEAIAARARVSVGGHAEPFRTMVGVALAVAWGIAFPSVFFIAAKLGLMDEDTAFAVAKWSGLGLVAAYGYLAARLSGGSVTNSLVQAAFAGVIAGVLILLKAFVH